MSNLPELGSTVRVRNQRATVRYVGATGFAEGVWVGLELLRPVGRNDGSVCGIRYFTCEPECGLFVPPSHVNPIAIADASAAPEPPKAEIASVWSNVESLQEGEALQVMAANSDLCCCLQPTTSRSGRPHAKLSV